ncbi:protein EARLY-RESPONSIVE TO DEHYDRATION 7, chloroplastic [Vicia villosa]|uniref:protein EARLY-RESPONSIVE TO DEHYDRATION 7, chloroplastic n=1 Tax=Vicia villosa TaxID=3911 RepID=UPI00273BB988|nr:protein EARLY-RESPONSIVE TO DEHYDRATION 7, chloroplastic [Vicia villosa]
MATQNPTRRASLYPEVIDSNPDAPSHPSSSSQSNLYPSIDFNDLVNNLFPDDVPAVESPNSPSAPLETTEEILVKIPGAILNLIDKEYSVELASGDFSVVRLRQGENSIAVYARIADEIQWPLAKEETAVKVDDSHYFFSFLAPKGFDEHEDEDDRRKKTDINSDLLSYGLTIASKGQERLLKELDTILANCSNFSVQKVSEKAKKKGEALDGSMAKEISPKDLESKKKKEIMEGQCAAYWTTLAPNVEDYSGSAARFIASGSGHVIKGILWCGDVTMDRLEWGNKVMKKRMASGSRATEISPETLKRIKRVKRVTKMTEKVANGLLSGVVKVSGFFTSSVVNSKAGKKFFSLLPGEVVLASLDGFSKVCDAVEVAGKNVMSTTSTVTTELVDHRYGEQAAHATSEGLDAAGHALGTAWVAFKIRKAINPKSVIKPTTLAKSVAKAAASDYKSSKSK